MSTVFTSSQASSARALTYASYISFIPIGIGTVILGPMLPALSARWSMDYSQGGLLILVQYAASTCAVAFSGVLAARYGFRFPMKTGLALMAMGLALFLSSSKSFAMIGIAANGAGLGLAVPAANLLVAAANPNRRSATLNLLNFFWSTGAVACSPLVSAAVKTHHLPLFLASVSGFSFLLAVGLASMGAHVVEPTTAIENKSPILPTIRGRQTTFLILAALFFLYVGVENGFGQWIASYAKSLGTLTLAMALITPSFFYACLTFGRLVAPAILRITDEITLVRIGLLASCLGIACLIFSHKFASIAISASASGLGLSIVYPIIIALFSRDFASARIGSIMFVLSNIGGGVLPWIVGVSSTKLGSLRTGLLVPVLGCTMMLMLFLRSWAPSGADASDPVLNNSRR
jgi:MFS transporter, FHS family, glucose/mannose:H+ symporter